MVAEPQTSKGFIDPSAPDVEVPDEKVPTAFAKRRAATRANRFLKGPIPLAWIREHVQSPADRLLLVLVAYSDMQRSKELKLTADILRDAGIADRKTSYRAIERLETNGSLSATRHRGRHPVIRLRKLPRRR